MIKIQSINNIYFGHLIPLLLLPSDNAAHLHGGRQCWQGDLKIICDQLSKSRLTMINSS